MKRFLILVAILLPSIAQAQMTAVIAPMTVSMLPATSAPVQQELGDRPFRPYLFTAMIIKDWTWSSDKERVSLWSHKHFTEKIEVMTSACRAEGIELDHCLAYGAHETRYRWWRVRPSREFCGMVQQAARYSMEPTLPSLRRGGPLCVRHEGCQEECNRLIKDFDYAVTRFIDYHHAALRAGFRGGLNRHACRYGGGLGNCNETYGANHEFWRRDVTRRYQFFYDQVSSSAAACL